MIPGQHFINAPLHQIDWLVAKIQSLDQSKRSYVVEAKIIF